MKELSRKDLALKLCQALLLVFIFLVGIRGLGMGFKSLGKDFLDMLFMATSNPFVALMVGILATTLVQSSSVTTAMIVALVAVPENPLPIPNAVPMIMGANIGTTVTNTLVSLGHKKKKQEFRRAFEVAICHDAFNFLTVAVLLPIELFTGYLSKLSKLIANMIGSGGPGKLPNPLKAATKETIRPITWALEQLSSDKIVLGIMMIVVSSVIIFTTLSFIVKTFKSLAKTKLKTYIKNSIGDKPLLAMAVGIAITIMVQSSSITTSVLVPVAAAGIITLPQAFPITLGANIGTTITAIIASMAAPAETAHLAVQIAAVHLLFNLSGILLIYPIKFIRNIPLNIARRLAEIAEKSKLRALGYVAGIFYLLPCLLIFISRL